MSQPEFDKLIARLEKLAKFGWYIYGMKLYEVYPVAWPMLIRNAHYAAQQYIEDDNLEIPLCHN